MVQHAEASEWCISGMLAVGIDPADLRCEVGLTPLGEWMNLRIYLPERISAHELPPQSAT